MAYSAVHVANTILQRAFREGRSDVSPMKLQKLMFFTHGWHLAVQGKPAIDKPFEVWQWGPVVSSIYHELKGFGSKPVTKYIPEYDPKTETYKSYVVNSSCKDLYEALDVAWEKYIGISATNLSAMTHAPGSPWDIAKQNGNSTISDDLIREYFVKRAKAA